MTPKKPQGAGVDVGDHIYVHHKGQPCTGRVLAHGKHGVTVHVDGESHKVKWEQVLGHKKRAMQRYSVIDEGEDGMIVQDAGGRRKYIGTPNEAKEDPMVAKAQRPVLLLAKAGTPRPGLTQKKVTDKNGVQTTKWVRVDAKSPPAQRGQHVGFENGEHKGHGEVVASGQHGVTVRDGAGGEHRVRHEKVTHHWGGDEKPDQSPHEPTGDPTPAQDGALFHPEEIAKLPAKVNQPHKTWDDLVTHGAEGLSQLKGQLGAVAQAMGLVSGKKTDDLTPDDWGSEKGFLFIAPLKGQKRAQEKVEADYGGDWSQLRDMVRATISVPSMGHVKQALGHLKTAGIELAQQPKDRFAKPTAEGYRDLMTIVKLPNGMLAELQVHVKGMTLAKEEGHEHYNVTRTLQGKYGEAEPTEKWSDDDHRSFYDALKAQKDIYSEAWSKSQAATKGRGSEPLQKSDNASKMIMFLRRIP